jgi:hypothetical protein
MSGTEDALILHVTGRQGSQQPEYHNNDQNGANDTAAAYRTETAIPKSAAANEKDQKYN